MPFGGLARMPASKVRCYSILCDLMREAELELARGRLGSEVSAQLAVRSLIVDHKCDDG